MTIKHHYRPKMKVMTLSAMCYQIVILFCGNTHTHHKNKPVFFPRVTQKKMEMELNYSLDKYFFEEDAEDLCIRITRRTCLTCKPLASLRFRESEGSLKFKSQWLRCLFISCFRKSSLILLKTRFFSLPIFFHHLALALSLALSLLPRGQGLCLILCYILRVSTVIETWQTFQKLFVE